MYRAGMASILSQLAREGRLAVVDSLPSGYLRGTYVSFRGTFRAPREIDLRHIVLDFLTSQIRVGEAKLGFISPPRMLSEVS